MAGSGKKRPLTATYGNKKAAKSIALSLLCELDSELAAGEFEDSKGKTDDKADAFLQAVYAVEHLARDGHI